MRLACPSPLFEAAIGAILIAAGSVTHAQDATYDPNQLPLYRGQVQLFTLTPRGDVDGLVLTDGTEIKTPPHLSTQLVLSIHPGDAVTIHGLKAAKLPLIQAMSITNDATGNAVVDSGPDSRGPGAAVAESGGRRVVTGRVRMPLHGPRGDVNGALLEDGTILRLPPAEADRFGALLSPGHDIAAEGASRVTVAGRLIEITALGPSSKELTPVR